MVMNQEVAHLYNALRNLNMSQSELARRLGLAQPTVWAWFNGQAKRGIPPEHCPKIERLTNGLVTRYDLRPDVFGDSPNTMHHKSQGQLLSEGERA